MGKDLFRLDDRVAIVTGGLGQLGRQYTRALLDQGARVCVLDVPKEGLARLGEAGFSESEDRLRYHAADVTSRSSRETARDAVVEAWGRVDALINNAALDSPPGSPAAENGPFEDYPEESWDRVLEVNAKGVFLACQVFGGCMAKQGSGSIVNVASIYGVVSPVQPIYEYRRQSGEAFFKPVAYSASKSALLNLTRYLATYWARQGVRVNTLTLAGVFNNQDERFLEGYCARMPMARMAREEEYNGAVVFLCSEASSYMTGSNLVIDGGWTAW